jgi:hypothetical protein
MVVYECERCCKKWKHKNNYTRHINRKYKCDIKDDSLSMNDDNNISQSTKYESLMKKMDEILEYNKKLEKKVDKFEKKADKLEKELAEIKKKPSVKINITINIMPFGKEDLSILSEDENIYILCKSYSCLYELIELVHFNKSRKKFHNIYIPTMKDRSNIMIYDGKNWILQNKNEVLDQLKTNMLDHIEDKLNEYKDTERLPVRKQENVEDFLDKMKKNDKYEKKVLKEIELLLYNKRNITLDTKKINNKSQKIEYNN